MCTVTYLKTAAGGFILSSNRDEHVERPAALAPRKHKLNDKYVFFPQDPQAGGTWIATCEYNHTLCLLNGGFEKHTHKPPYRRSRGLMLLDFYGYDGVNDFINNYDFKGIEPFTLLIVNSNNTLALHQVVWDGEQLHHEEKDPNSAYIWSSSTLYTPEIRQERESWFSAWLAKTPNPNLDDILHFHEFSGKGDVENDFVMQRSNGVKTQAITAVVNEDTCYKMVYYDLLKNDKKSYRILKSQKICK